MLYLYTLLMFAWDLDYDTHTYFRKILYIFILHRKISNEYRKFLKNSCPQIIYEPLKINVIRYGLPRRYRGYNNGLSLASDPPLLIDYLYPTKYYIAGIQGSHSEVWLDITTITKTIIFRLPPYEDIVQICKDHYSRVPEIANREFNIRSAPNEIKLIRYLMEIEDL